MKNKWNSHIDDDEPTGAVARYRFFWIVPKEDFSRAEQGMVGFVVIDQNHTNVMPGAAWFESIESAKRAIDVFIGVRGNPEMFWEIIQPFQYTPGEKNSGYDTKVECGYHFARIENGFVVEIGMMDKPRTF